MLLVKKNTNNGIKVGKSIQSLVDTLKEKYNGDNIKYMIVIEGMSSKDNYLYNYQLSYERALALYRFWQLSGIHLDRTICEVLISGSGTGGVGRFQGSEEVKNQRFLIQIIPKIGQIDDLKFKK